MYICICMHNTNIILPSYKKKGPTCKFLLVSRPLNFMWLLLSLFAEVPIYYFKESLFL